MPQPSNSLDLESFWMPFTGNRRFKAHPRLLSEATGLYYKDPDGRPILDGCAGLWCVNLGHGRREITTAVADQLERLDFAPTFQMGHPLAFELASKLGAHAPPGLNRVFFANSGSEAVDSALKIAFAYHRARGEGQRQRVVGREKGYHGVGFGGLSAGGLVNNRRTFPQLPAAHMRHTHDPSRNAFARGLPAFGAALADDLERIVGLYGAETIAAVIVEPVAGSVGVLPPPKGYLKRLRDLCDRHGLLLIFDEVITGFGRVGAAFASEAFGVTPDMITTAKGLTNGAIPMGAVLVHERLYEEVLAGSPEGIEFFHGYTYSGHPVACAAALASLDLYEREDIYAYARDLAPEFECAVHGLRGLPHLEDIRNIGLMAAIDLEPRPGAPGARGLEALQRAFDAGLLIRVTGDTIALSPPLVIDGKALAKLFELLSATITLIE